MPALAQRLQGITKYSNRVRLVECGDDDRNFLCVSSSRHLLLPGWQASWYRNNRFPHFFPFVLTGR